MPVTAIDGGHITSIADSNEVIRQIVEARNHERAALADDDGELEHELKKTCDMGCAEPLVGVFDLVEENPKDVIGSGKLPLHLWPTTATAMGSIALLNGALKYGRSNWRKLGVRASVYVDACQRHMAAWFEGEECDEEGGAASLGCVGVHRDHRRLRGMRHSQGRPAVPGRASRGDRRTHAAR